MIEIFGYLASICLMLSGLPQVRKTIRQGHSHGISTSFLILLLVGFSSMIVYVVSKKSGIPLVINYVINLISYLIITYYKFFPRKHGQAFHSF